MLDAVRVWLRAEQPRDATRTLDAYRQRFPAGELALEAEVLRIDVAQREGRRADAMTLARALVERPGAERYRARLGSLLAGERSVGGTSTPRREAPASGSNRAPLHMNEPR